MKILITTPQGQNFDRHFPAEILTRLRTMGEVILNTSQRQLSRDDVKEMICDCDIVMTHWGSIRYDAEILNNAPKLKMLAHCAGTVANIASEECYNRGIQVLSANPIMARYVAEGVLGFIIAGLRGIMPHDGYMREGKWLRRQELVRSLLDTEIGLIGLGAVGRNLLDLLRPFGCPVYVYDPYISPDALDAWEFARYASFDEAMSRPVVSIHASQTPETFHMINESALALMPDGGLLINSSRGSLVDTEALIKELESGRIGAVLDVYENEGKPQPERLLACRENLILQPHLAAMPAGSRMTSAVVDDIERYLKGEPLKLTVSHHQFSHMTKE
jgi:phosphoglycerate dehydrogenase-like enzyme